MSQLPNPQVLSIGGKVLAVDDQEENLLLIEDILVEVGFEVSLAQSAEEALTAVAEDPPDCILLDIMMPGIDGFEMCRRLKSDRRTHYTPVVMLTALTSVDDKVRAFDMGADDFLNKPIIAQEVIARVRSMVRIKRLRDELDSSEDIILTMVEALESKDPRAAGHSRRVAAGSIMLARELQLDQRRVELVAKGAILHDLGRIGLSSKLMAPIHELSELQQKELEQHTVIGERILAPFLSFAKIRTLVRSHHERLDGSGYPDGISGAELGLETEVVGLVNHYDALCTQRIDEVAAREELRTLAEQGAFHRDLVETFLASCTQETLRRHAPHWSELLPFPNSVDPGRILVVSGNSATRTALERILIGEGHETHGVDSGHWVSQAIQDQRADLVLLEIDLLDVNGIELARSLKSQPEHEFLPLILVTAQHDTTFRNSSTAVGADDFLFLPINRMELVARVKSLLRLRTFFTGLEEHQSVILALASALEARDAYTRGHSERVGVLSAKLARTMGLSAELCLQLRAAGQIHDIGKIGMPNGLLNKRERLTDDEFRLITCHPVLGERICQPLRTMRPLLPYVRCHHERFDGSGYPDGLVGEEIPLGARILGLVDAYDALTSARSYRSNYSPSEALQVLERETRAGRWDPAILKSLATIIRRS